MTGVGIELSQTLVWTAKYICTQYSWRNHEIQLCWTATAIWPRNTFAKIQLVESWNTVAKNTDIMESRNTCVNQFYSHKNTNLCSEHLCLQQPYEEIHSQKYSNGITKYSCKKQNGVEELRNTVAKKYGYNGVEKYLREPVPPTQHIKPSSEHLCWH